MRTWLSIVFLLASAQFSSAGQARSSRDAQLADIDLVRSEYLVKEKAFSPVARRRAAGVLARMSRQAGRLSHGAMLAGLAQVGALADNAHSGVRFHDVSALPRRLPIRLLWFADALLVARAQSAYADLAGAEVVAIEGHSAKVVYRRARRLAGGSDVNRRKDLPELLESEGVLHAIGLARAADSIEITLRTPDGSLSTRRLPMVDQAQSRTADGERLWAPQPITGEHGWVPALRMDAVPLYLHEPDRIFRAEHLGAALYIQFRSNEDEKGYPIAEFLAHVAERIAATKPRDLIVDLRFDVGGNLSTTAEFMRRLPTSVAGRTILLVGNYTFSAGIISAALIKKSGRERVTVIGDELGDRSHFWSEGAVIRLPNSHFGMRYTDGQFDLVHGCTGRSGCMDKLVDANFASLVPDVCAPLTAEAWLGGKDPAMTAALAILAKP